MIQRTSCRVLVIFGEIMIRNLNVSLTGFLLFWRRYTDEVN